ncbi:MAG TPA: alkaline phosphatase family protein [Candidatus Limnocylindrales bacterium]|nr:alkaline phosphatase family protein [Candidatus Limnocylindrales bacterium]
MVVVAGVGSCTPAGRHEPRPVVVLGIDGLEWRLVLELIRKGEMPNLAQQMSRGSYGRLTTLHPSMSPAIWTSVATGVAPSEHGIRGFIHSKNKLFTNRDRRTKALWNIATDHGLTSQLIGWWMTYPVEPIRGIMVAQANTSMQLVREADGILKGQLVQGLDHQIHPPELNGPILAMAADVEKHFDDIVRGIVPKIPPDDDPAVTPLWKQSRWAIRADAIYERVAEETLRREPNPDLLMLYFGGTDVLGHRFWRWAYPDDYKHPPSAESVAAYGSILRDYYRYTDQRIGKILASAPPDANVIIMSDHGMGAGNRKRDFAESPDKPLRTGVHGQSEALLVIAGPDIARAKSAGSPQSVREKDLDSLGSVFDVAPTVLALLGIEVASDMKGRALTSLITAEFLARHPIRTVPTHTPKGWAKTRNLPETETPGEDERLEQLRSLGYIQ